jgi:hypothetical protein
MKSSVEFTNSAPHPRVHAAHRGAHHEAQVIHTEAFRDELMLRGHHVVIIVLRKFHAQAVTGLARFSMANVVGDDDVVARDVELATRSEQHSGENRIQ